MKTFILSCSLRNQVQHQCWVPKFYSSFCPCFCDLHIKPSDVCFNSAPYHLHVSGASHLLTVHQNAGKLKVDWFKTHIYSLIKSQMTGIIVLFCFFGPINGDICAIISALHCHMHYHLQDKSLT